jgi:NTP pyrophosphatase (non-canonical NTP hydrolase)
MAQVTATKIYEYEGKKYRLADHRDIGKNVYVDDDGFDLALEESNRLQCVLGSIDPTREFSFKADNGSRWAYAFVELEAPVPAVVPFNGTLEVGQWYETGDNRRFQCILEIPEKVHPMLMLDEEGDTDRYMPDGLHWEDADSDEPENIALHLVGCTGFDWAKPVPPAPAPEPQTVDTRPTPPVGWRYVAEDEVLVDGDVYFCKHGVEDVGVCSGLGSTVTQLQKQGQGHWASYWIGVIRKIPKRDTGVAEVRAETATLSYEGLVKALAKPGQDIVDEMTASDAHLIHMVVGVCGEAGELLDAIKKAVIYRKELDRVNVIEELGDIEFYMEGLRQGLGITREQCIKENSAKLTKRYGSMYSNEAAKNRADKTE